MPNVRGLMQRGSAAFSARTTEVAITLPSHTSMLTGVTPERHQVSWNDDLPKDRPQRYPAVPTLFEAGQGAGYSTAMVTGKSSSSRYDGPGSVDWIDLPTDKLRSDRRSSAPPPCA